MNNHCVQGFSLKQLAGNESEIFCVIAVQNTRLFLVAHM